MPEGSCIGRIIPSSHSSTCAHGQRGAGPAGMEGGFLRFLAEGSCQKKKDVTLLQATRGNQPQEEIATP